MLRAGLHIQRARATQHGGPPPQPRLGARGSRPESARRTSRAWLDSSTTRRCRAPRDGHPAGRHGEACATSRRPLRSSRSGAQPARFAFAVEPAGEQLALRAAKRVPTVAELLHVLQDVLEHGAAAIRAAFRGCANLAVTFQPAPRGDSSTGLDMVCRRRGSTSSLAGAGGREDEFAIELGERFTPSRCTAAHPGEADGAGPD